jgi:hypothetical protein
MSFIVVSKDVTTGRARAVARFNTSLEAKSYVNGMVRHQRHGQKKAYYVVDGFHLAEKAVAEHVPVEQKQRVYVCRKGGAPSKGGGGMPS